MIQDGVLVDTSAFISFFRGLEYADEVAELLNKNRVVITGIIVAELLQGIKDKGERQKISELCGAVCTLEITTPLWVKAGLLASSLREKGIMLPLTDIAIAVVALEHDLQVLTLDSHFRKIEGVKLYTPLSAP
jgi:predicted nucleic acid-binding protein